MYVIIGERTKEGFKTIERRGNSEELDLEPIAEILTERLLQMEKEGTNVKQLIAQCSN
jgi:hypothetical protein